MSEDVRLKGVLRHLGLLEEETLPKEVESRLKGSRGLRPCPHCDGVLYHFHEQKEYEEGTVYSWYAICDKCGEKFPVYRVWKKPNGEIETFRGGYDLELSFL